MLAQRYMNCDNCPHVLVRWSMEISNRAVVWTLAIWPPSWSIPLAGMIGMMGMGGTMMGGNMSGMMGMDRLVVTARDDGSLTRDKTT